MVGLKSTMPTLSGSGNNFKPYYINEFEVIAPLTTDKSGFSKWGKCDRNGIRYFIKEFLSPVYPDNNVGLSEEIMKSKINQCNEWFEKQNKLYHAVSDSQTGNIISPVKFFKNANHFYLVTELVDNKNDKMTFEMLCRNAEYEQRIILIKTLAYAFSRLHENKVVHSDIKPENLLLKKTIDGFYTIKVIDFDSGYLEMNPPEGEDVQGNLVYDSPEILLSFNECYDKKLNCKTDVFSLGLIFHQILCGEFPYFSDEYDYINEAVLDDSEIKLSNSLTDDYRMLIEKMLARDVDKRPSMKQVFDEIMNTGKTVLKPSSNKYFKSATSF